MEVKGARACARGSRKKFNFFVVTFFDCCCCWLGQAVAGTVSPIAAQSFHYDCPCWPHDHHPQRTKPSLPRGNSRRTGRPSPSLPLLNPFTPFARRATASLPPSCQRLLFLPQRPCRRSFGSPSGSVTPRAKQP